MSSLKRQKGSSPVAEISSIAVDDRRSYSRGGAGSTTKLINPARLPLLNPHKRQSICRGRTAFPTGIGKRSPEDLPTRESTSKKVITKQILDEKPGLANGQPKINVDDSLLLFRAFLLDESL